MEKRLQIQEKYKVLMPVIKKINEASLERRKWEDEVKRLLQEITDMKKKLLKSQQDFNIHVSNLVQEKERIDKRLVRIELKFYPLFFIYFILFLFTIQPFFDTKIKFTCKCR